MSREELLDIAVVRQWGEFRNDNMLCVLGFQSLYRPGTSPLHCDGKTGCLFGGRVPADEMRLQTWFRREASVEISTVVQL